MSDFQENFPICTEINPALPISDVENSSTSLNISPTVTPVTAQPSKQTCRPCYKAPTVGAKIFKVENFQFCVYYVNILQINFRGLV